MPLTPEQKQLWHYKKAFQAHVDNVSVFIAAIDNLMKNEKESFARGQKISKLIGALEMCNDAAKRYGLRLPDKTPGQKEKLKAVPKKSDFAGYVHWLNSDKYQEVRNAALRRDEPDEVHFSDDEPVSLNLGKNGKILVVEGKKERLIGSQG